MKNNNQKIPIIFLVSYGHSGSTLFDMVFDSHSQFVGAGELNQYFVLRTRGFLCTCGKKLDQCDFWQKIFAGVSEKPDLRIAKSKIDFLLNKQNYFYTYLGKKYKVDLKEHLKQREELYRRIALYSGKKIIFDSSKEPHMAEPLFLNDNFEVILLHLVRDGRGVVYSYKKSYPERSSLKVAYRWAATNLKIELIKRRHLDKSIFIRYNDFTKNPRLVLEKVLNNLNFSYESAMLRFDEKEHHQAGGNVNARIHRKKDNQIREDASWKTGLSFKDKFIFNLVFGWLNFYYQKIKKTI